eukprot:11442239-Ditylum_brightwellii.AAC.1
MDQQPNEDDIQSTPALQQLYRLRNRAVNITNSAIIEETSNIAATTHGPKHVGKYMEAIKFLAINMAFKRKLYSPTG